MQIRVEPSFIDRVLWLALAAGTLGFVLGGCAAKTVRPDELSAENHRKEAAREEKLAADDRARYDPQARAISYGQPAGLPTASDYNPTERHLRKAADHAAHARQHQQAAAELERFEDTSCSLVATAERAACPMLGPAATIADIEGGVRVEPRDASRVQPLYQRMRCHLAYARTRGYATAPECPLYMKGVEIRPSGDGRAIDLVAHDAKIIDELRHRVREEASAGDVL